MKHTTVQSFGSVLFIFSFFFSFIQQGCIKETLKTGVMAAENSALPLHE